MWLKPIILALGNLKEEGRFEASLSYREFQDSLGYLSQKKKKKIKRKKKGIKERIKQDLNPEAQTLKKH